MKIKLLKLLKKIRKLNRIYLIFLICFHKVNCLEKKSIDYQEEDLGLYNNVANIIQNQQSQISNQTSSNDFKPSNWIGSERLRKLKRIDNYDKLRKLQEYKYLKSKASDEESNSLNFNSNSYNSNNYQFKRRSDLDDDYYAPTSYLTSTNPHYNLVYPPVQPVISLPAAPSTILAPTYYRRYRPSASRNYYHRIYSPPANAMRRRLAAAASTNSNYETAIPYHSPSAAYHSLYYGSGLASHPHIQYPANYPPTSAAAVAYPNYPNSHGLAHAAEHDAHHERTEIHSLLPIITVIGIGEFAIVLLFYYNYFKNNKLISCLSQNRCFYDTIINYIFYRNVIYWYWCKLLPKTKRTIA